jgi:hypothetical protein
MKAYLEHHPLLHNPSNPPCLIPISHSLSVGCRSLLFPTLFLPDSDSKTCIATTRTTMQRTTPCEDIQRRGEQRSQLVFPYTIAWSDRNSGIDWLMERQSNASRLNNGGKWDSRRPRLIDSIDRMLTENGSSQLTLISSRPGDSEAYTIFRARTRVTKLGILHLILLIQTDWPSGPAPPRPTIALPTITCHIDWPRP